MTIFVQCALQVAVVVLLALAAAALMRKRSAAIRHWILAIGLVFAFAMPALQAIAPRWGMPRTRIDALVGDTGAFAPVAGQPWLPVPQTIQTVGVAQQPVSFARAAGLVWIAGVVVGLVLLYAGFARLTWIASRCEPVIDRRWLTPAREIATQLGLRRDIAVLQSAHESLL